MQWLFKILVAFLIYWEIINYVCSFQTCPENMISYALDENSTNWTCDCFASYLYFSKSDSCYEPYKQGPCPPENYLVLPPGEILARCEKNPCLEDGLVPFEGACSRLNEHCGLHEYNYLIVDQTDFKISCDLPVLHAVITAPGKTCPNGSRRSATGMCRKVLQ
ncbi:uncharacterized protein LOC117173007 [Belonocnema kinseyi]|uniref:uncharacterized protein LOC117173007 n=1 Tax=Belonocnema kinseyi TaxID=2817044 RepID=UPI00143DF57B|nr:uncharacterized protein LOC117173007 [Belonocnema kinseyi]